jgi:hypothetical protein
VFVVQEEPLLRVQFRAARTLSRAPIPSESPTR